MTHVRRLTPVQKVALLCVELADRVRALEIASGVDVDTQYSRELVHEIINELPELSGDVAPTVEVK